jgi:hypothetical protein
MYTDASREPFANDADYTKELSHFLVSLDRA